MTYMSLWTHVVAHYVAYMYDKTHGLPLAAHVGLLCVHVYAQIYLYVYVYVYTCL
jgi:hypothetical protein